MRHGTPAPSTHLNPMPLCDPSALCNPPQRLEYRGYDSAGISVDLEPCPQNGYTTGVAISAAGACGAGVQGS